MTAWQAEEIRQAIRETFGPYESHELLRAFDSLIVPHTATPHRPYNILDHYDTDEGRGNGL